MIDQGHDLPFAVDSSHRGEGRHDLTGLEQKLGHSFREPELLERALTHKSYAHEAGASPLFHNEPLEFLGDAVLGFLVTDLIFRAFPSVSEGRLSKIKAYLVSAATLFVLAESLDLPSHLRLGKGEEKTGGRKKKALSANAFEALVAAVYLDAGIDITRAILDGLYAPAIREIREGRAIVEDPKTALQEYLQARNLPAARYRVTRESGPEHRKTFHVELAIGDRTLATASGTTKKRAQAETAQSALQRLHLEEGEKGG